MIERYVLADLDDVQSSTLAGNFPAFSELVENEHPEQWRQNFIVEFPMDVYLEVTNNSLLRQRIGEQYSGFNATYLRWTTKL